MQNNVQNIRIASRDALKYVYYVIIGIAITEALSRTFVEGGVFLGVGIFNKVTFILLFAFLPTICRFVHGASIHLDVISKEKRFKTIIDCGGFLLQAIFFYLMAVSINKTMGFVVSLGLMLLIDSLWLIFLFLIKYIPSDFTHKQWLCSNFIVLVLLGASFFLMGNAKVGWPIFIAIISVIAAFFDYYLNRDFYFPKG